MVRSLFAFIQKEIYHILRDTRTLYILFGMPIVLVLIFGYTVTNEFKDASIAIVDHSKDDLSSTFKDHMISSGHFSLISEFDNIPDLENAFSRGEVKMGIVIPPEFEKKYFKNQKVDIQLIADATEPNYATTLNDYASFMIRSFRPSESEQNQIKPIIKINVRMLYNPSLIGAYNFIPGVVALILMLICAMMTSLTIAKEKETGTMDLLLVSPLPPILIIVGKVIPYALLSFINALMVFAMGYYIFDVPILGSLSLLLLLTFLYLGVALALGILISTRSKNQQTAMMASLFALLLPTMLLSGFIFPIASMPALLQYISAIIPAKYFILIQKAIMLKGAGWDSILFPTTILIIMVFILLMAALRNFKTVYK